jgi:hypothetical protein
LFFGVGFAVDAVDVDENDFEIHYGVRVEVGVWVANCEM